MKISHGLGLLVLASILLVSAGCSGGTADKQGKGEGEVKGALAKLGPEDRRLAEAQERCPITGEPLGSMGVPVKLKIQDETAFLCCESCRDKALADPRKTLARVRELRAKAASPAK